MLKLTELRFLHVPTLFVCLFQVSFPQYKKYFFLVTLITASELHRENCHALAVIGSIDD